MPSLLSDQGCYKMTCAPDPMFPLTADVYYATAEQSAYGNLKKTWILDQTLACAFSSDNSDRSNIKTEFNIINDLVIVGRFKKDVRFSNRDENNSLTNIVITNIRNSEDTHIYTETSGPRAGKSTIFEIASFEPFIGPFANVEYYAVKLRRSENQAVDV